MANMMGRDMQSCTGLNLAYLREETGLDPWSCASKQVRVAMENRLAVVPRLDQWRLPFLARLLVERGERYYQCEDTDLLTEQIDALCAN